ncbi:peroxiredoxin family protein [Parapedobacter sp. 10938]|uniref:peroxiredoxin family protein n=1 Tax=Parapedobacter flavus TaxID=3110225 RepID=UPI002DBB991F|nr:redoxin domain-containing protein [Parapedobacter sp. 10938]MEC3879853.1 redoxin domain-containing protein [Parapedobacter sp. 10938]
MTTRINLLSKLAAAAFITVALACNNRGTTRHSDQEVPPATSSEQAHATASSSHQPQPPTPTAEPAVSIPDFTFYILKSGIRFTKDDLAKTGNIVFVLFDPTCSHCQQEANDIGKHYDQVKDANFYFVSMNDPALMASFLDTWAKPLVGKENVEVLYDRGADFINKFHLPSQYPATYVYGAGGELKEFWNGERDVNEIVAAINK